MLSATPPGVWVAMPPGVLAASLSAVPATEWLGAPTVTSSLLGTWARGWSGPLGTTVRSCFGVPVWSRSWLVVLS